MTPQIDSPESRVLHAELRLLCQQTVAAAAAVATTFLRKPIQVALKHDQSEVTPADYAMQEEVLRILRKARPADWYIAEETTESSEDHSPPANDLPPSRRAVPLDPSVANGRGRPRICWVIDPLDGTRNFSRGLPVFGSTVAALLEGSPAAGAIYSHTTSEVLSGSAVEGLFINGHPASDEFLAQRRSLHGSISPLVAIPTSARGNATRIAMDWIERLHVRNLGSAAIHLALVAENRLQATLLSDTRLWDIAAGWLLVRLAGGVVRGLVSEPMFPIDPLAYNGEPTPILAAATSELFEAVYRPEIMGGIPWPRDSYFD
jgi:myo-inositol-1(or 4)-monophosphatase